MHSLSRIHGGFLRIHRSTQFCFFNSCSCCFYKIRVTSRSLSNSTVAPVRRPQACPFQQFISFEMSKKLNDSDFFFRGCHFLYNNLGGLFRPQYFTHCHCLSIQSSMLVQFHPPLIPNETPAQPWKHRANGFV